MKRIVMPMKPQQYQYNRYSCEDEGSLTGPHPQMQSYRQFMAAEKELVFSMDEPPTGYLILSGQP